MWHMIACKIFFNNNQYHIDNSSCTIILNVLILSKVSRAGVLLLNIETGD